MAAKSKSSRKAARKESPDGTELLVLELQEIHSAESQLMRALPRMAKAVESQKLQQMLATRQQQGERLIEEIEAALEEMAESPSRKRNVAAEGLINDMKEHVQEIEAGPALDAVLIAAIQKTEHYCIAAWGTARSMAQALDQRTVVKSMERALKEGKQLDEDLTELAEGEVNPALLSAAASMEGQEEQRQSRGRQGQGRSSRRGGSERRAT
jgi:ferritin-like metal-binding protein YciE